jgi:hypothetical protein
LGTRDFGAGLARAGEDARFAFRMFRRHPGIYAAIVLTLAVGIGAASTMFTVLHSVLLQPLPYPDADRLAGPLL